MSETFRLTRYSSSWDDLNVFRDWYHELKKCRPMVNFSFTPTRDQAMVLQEYHAVSVELERVYEQLNKTRNNSNNAADVKRSQTEQVAQL